MEEEDSGGKFGFQFVHILNLGADWGAAGNGAVFGSDRANLIEANIHCLFCQDISIVCFYIRADLLPYWLPGLWAALEQLPVG